MSKHKKGPEKKKAEPGKLEFKMRWMLFSTMIPMAVLIIVLLAFFWQYTNEYNKLSIETKNKLILDNKLEVKDLVSISY